MPPAAAPKIATATDGDETRSRRRVFVEERKIGTATTDGFEYAQQSSRHDQNVVLGLQRREELRQQQLESTPTRRIESADRPAIAKIDEQSGELGSSSDTALGQHLGERGRATGLIEHHGESAAGLRHVGVARARAACARRGRLVLAPDRRKHERIEGALHLRCMVTIVAQDLLPICMAHGPREPRLCIGLFG